MPPPPNLDDLKNRRVYPGMSIGESRILRSWIERHGVEWDTLNVAPRVGPGVLAAPHFSDKERADWYQRTRARPDAIASRTPNEALIIEAKEYATAEAIWQVKSYATLYEAETPGVIVRTLVICEGFHPTAAALARAQGVEMLTYEFDEALPAEPGTEVPQ